MIDSDFFLTDDLIGLMFHFLVQQQTCWRTLSLAHFFLGLTFF